MRDTLLLFLLSLPLKHLQVTSGFGNRIHPVTGIYCRHAGVDLRADYDTVFAVIDSHVGSIGYDCQLGIYLRISTGPFTVTYGHLSNVLVGKTDTLASGQAIAISGASGRVTGPHLHFAVQFNHRYIDPLAFLSAAYQRISKP